MISADLLSDEHFNSLSLEAQNIFIRMLAVSDDCGVVPASEYRLNVLINTPKPLSKKINKILDEILSLGLGVRFTHGEEEFFAFKPGPFQDYQSYILNKARKSEYLRISRDEYAELSKKFSEVPRSSRNNFPSAVRTVESREQRAESREQRVESNDPVVNGFETLWEQYPMKQGKQHAAKHYRATVKTQDDLDKIGVALSNYLACGRVAAGVIQNGSTWFDDWEAWYKPTKQMMEWNVNGKQSGSQESRASSRVTDEDKRRADALARRLGESIK